MQKPESLSQPGLLWQPREFFEFAEAYAGRIRKVLRNAERRAGVPRTSVSMDDAVALAALAENLARHGKRASAEDAIVIAGYVEHTLDMLRTEINAILAS